MSEQQNEVTEPTPEMMEAIERTLYHHQWGGRAILELLTRREFPITLAQPTEEQKKVAHDTVEELLKIHYNTFNASMKEVIGEELEDNPYVKK